jgi:hypothetical protein
MMGILRVIAKEALIVEHDVVWRRVGGKNMFSSAREANQVYLTESEPQQKKYLIICQN